MIGDLYHVHYNRFGSNDTHESELGPQDTWQAAKEERNRIYMTFGQHVRAAWIIRRQSGLKDERYGEVLRRKKPQA